MTRFRIVLLSLLLATAAACDATRITADAPPPPSCGDGPEMGSTC